MRFEEGQIWEAAMFAGARKLDNLVVIVDNNNLQIDGAVSTTYAPRIRSIKNLRHSIFM